MIDQTLPSIGLIVVLSRITITTFVNQRVNRRIRSVPVQRFEDRVNTGSGFIVDGTMQDGTMQNKNESTRPIIVSVAHLIPTETNSVNQFFVKLFHPVEKLSKIYKLKLITFNRGVDLVLFDFETPIENPFCLKWNTVSNQGDRCFVTGFPLGDSQLSIVDGTIRDPTYCFSNCETGIDQIYHSAPSTSGNSGSCIVNESGEVVGIHAWGYYQNQSTVFENFTGGPSAKSAFSILSYMISKPELYQTDKFFPRPTLGIRTKLVNDLFRIINFSNGFIQNNDGIIVESIIDGGTIAAHNLQPGTVKIQVNDLITYIFDQIRNEYIPVGYSREAPLNALFRNTLGSLIKIKIRKYPSYATEEIVEISNPKTLLSQQDSAFNSLI